MTRHHRVQATLVLATCAAFVAASGCLTQTAVTAASVAPHGPSGTVVTFTKEGRFDAGFGVAPLGPVPTTAVMVGAAAKAFRVPANTSVDVTLTFAGGAHELVLNVDGPDGQRARVAGASPVTMALDDASPGAWQAYPTPAGAVVATSWRLVVTLTTAPQVLEP